ncbi:MAG: polymer-forming cytoskeletal protein [Leeuwenhoekiella sp.]
MRTVITILLCLCFASSAFAQKSIEKSIAYKDQNIEFDLKFAKNITLKVWDKSTIELKGTISTLGDKYLDLYKLEVDENSSKIKIVSNPEAMFKKFNEDRKNDKNNYYLNEYEYTEAYTLYVPKKATLKISSINGDLQADLVDGTFTADLINGNIEIIEYSGDLALSTINGTIDLKVINTSLKAETLQGQIYADEKLSLNSSDQVMGQKINGSFDTAANSLNLHTINGNIYLRR